MTGVMISEQLSWCGLMPGHRLRSGPALERIGSESVFVGESPVIFILQPNTERSANIGLILDQRPLRWSLALRRGLPTDS